MTSKERVYGAINRTPIDHVPQYIWLGPTVAKHIAEKEGIPLNEVDTFIGNDVVQTWISINTSMEYPLADGETFTDEWGITWLRDGIYNTPVKHPFAGMGVDEIKAHPFPDPKAPERFAVLDGLIEKYGKTHFIGADISSSIIEPAYHLRGMVQILMDLIIDEDIACAILDKMSDFTMAVAEEALNRDVDWIWLGDDIGSQQGMILSPEVWRKYIKPRMKRIIDRVQEIRPGTIIAYHSCGTIRQIIGDLVEIGVNVLNPVQESAVDMNQAEIKAEYGHALTFMCGLDTQQFLVDATPEEVRAKMEETIAKLSAGGGGYIHAVSHTIQPDVPIENIYALLRGIK